MVDMVDVAFKVPAEIAKYIAEHKDIAEIVIRRDDKKFKEFFKAIASHVQSEDAQKVRHALAKAAKALKDKNIADINIDELLKINLPKDIHKQLLEIRKLKIPNPDAIARLATQAAAVFSKSAAVGAWVGTALSAVTLVATIANTVIVCQKLDAIKGHLDELDKKIDKGFEDLKRIAFETDIRKPSSALLLEYQQISGDIEKGIPVSEKSVVRTIKDCYSCIESALRLIPQLGLEEMLGIINSLLPVYAYLMILYYTHFFNPAYGEHSLHQSWMKLFDEVSSPSLIDQLQDMLILEKHMHNA